MHLGHYTFWNRSIILAMCTETVIVYNMDAYFASMPLWFQQKGQLSSLGFVMGVVILATMFGGFAAGSLVDRFGTRRIQGASLIVMLLVGVQTPFAHNGMEMMILQSMRDFSCAVGIVTCGMRARALLPADHLEQLQALGQLNIWSYAASALFVWIGPVLLIQSIDWWHWLGPVITIIGLLEVMFNKHDYRPDRKAPNNTGFWDWDILKLVTPVLGISIVHGVVTTYLILDVGVNLGAPVCSIMNISAGVAGVLIPVMVRKWGDKMVIRILMSLLTLAVPCFIWPKWYTLVFVGLSVGLSQVGLNIILTIKRPNTGRSASMHAVVDYGGAAFSSSLWGVLRNWVGVVPAYALLLVPIFVFFFVFELLFRSARWKTQR